MGKVVGTRYPTDVESQLNTLEDKQAFIRGAVELAFSDPAIRDQVEALAKQEEQK